MLILIDKVFGSNLETTFKKLCSDILPHTILYMSKSIHYVKYQKLELKKND